MPAFGTYRYLGVRGFAVDVLLMSLSSAPRGVHDHDHGRAPPPNPALSIVKLTNGTNNDTGTGPLVAVGSRSPGRTVTNTGNVPLTGVAVTDDKAGAVHVGTLAAGAAAPACTNRRRGGGPVPTPAR